jgi:hypothetical protein
MAFVQFETADASRLAAQALGGRQFDGNTVRASFVQQHDFPTPQ